MGLTEALGRLLTSFECYYNIKREDVTLPFAAEAEFHLHDSQYFLMKSAKISESDSREYIFFSLEEQLSLEKLIELDEKAWSECMNRVQPMDGHKNTDAALIILAEKIDGDAFSAVRSLRHTKSYRLGLWGWSNYRLIVFELSSGRIAHNRLGESLKRLVSNIY